MVIMILTPSRNLDKLIVINTLIRGGINKMDDYSYSDMYRGYLSI